MSNGEKTGKQKENTLNNTFKTVFVNRLSEVNFMLIHFIIF